MAEPGTAQHALRQHVVVVGADPTTVRLAEELVRSGEQLVVIAHGENPPGASRILAWSRSSGTNWQWGHLDHAVAGNERIALLRPGPGWHGSYEQPGRARRPTKSDEIPKRTNAELERNTFTTGRSSLSCSSSRSFSLP